MPKPPTEPRPIGTDPDLVVPSSFFELLPEDLLDTFEGGEKLMTAEAVKCIRRGETFEIELVEGWRGEPHNWGNHRVHEEENEAAIHGMAPNEERDAVHDILLPTASSGSVRLRLGVASDSARSDDRDARPVDRTLSGPRALAVMVAAAPTPTIIV